MENFPQPRNTLFNVPKSQDIEVNEVIETITSTCDSNTDKAEPLHEAADEEHQI